MLKTHLRPIWIHAIVPFSSPVNTYIGRCAYFILRLPVRTYLELFDEAASTTISPAMTGTVGILAIGGF